MNQRRITLIISILLFMIVIVLSSCMMTALQEKEKICTEATVTHIQEDIDKTGEKNYKIYVEYDTEEGVKEDIIDKHSSNIEKGDTIEIDCHMENKYDVIESGMLGTMIITGILFVIGTIKLIKVIYEIYQEYLNNKIMKTKETITAKIKEVKVSQKRSKLSSTIYCNWINPNDNKEYQFKTDLDYNPIKYLKQANIMELPVHINHKNLKKYVVDTGNLKQLREVDTKAWEETFHKFERGEISIEEYQEKRNEYYNG